MSTNELGNANNMERFYRDKLEWYMNEATEDEYNEEEVRSINSILKNMDLEELDENVYNAEKGFERFMATLDIRMKIHDEMEKMNAKACNTKKRTFMCYGFRKVVMAASLVAMVVVGGAVGSYAQKLKSFNDVKDTKEELHAMVNPNEDSDVFSKKFKDFKTFPMKYLLYTWTPISMPNDMELNNIDLLQDEVSINVKCEYFNNDTKQFVSAVKRTFINKITVTNRIYDDMELYKEEWYDSIKVRYFKKTNDDGVEYVALFMNNNSVYILNSNCEFESIENIIIENITENNL